MKPKTIVTLGMFILLAILIIQNTHSVALKIFFWQPEIPLIILIVVVLLAGIVAGMFMKNIIKTASKKKDEY